MDVRSSIGLASLTLWLGVLSAGWTGAQSPGTLQRVEKSDEVMGSSFSIVAYGSDRARLEAAVAAGFDEAHRLDRMLSNYTAASEWSAVNREAGARPVNVSSELFALLSACLDYSRQSDGAFDITVGPLVDIWGFHGGDGQLPAAQDVTKALDRVGYRHVQLDPTTQTVRFDRPGMKLDPGGIGKGYAVDRVVSVLKESGVPSALVSASGSSIYGLGAPPQEPKGWPITIRAPRDPRQSAAEVFLKDLSMSTSGSYEKFFRAGGRTYSHIIDPRTGYPSQGSASVSVIAPRTIDSEAWTKPYFINGRAWTAANKLTGLRVFFCEEGDRGCQWIP